MLELLEKKNTHIHQEELQSQSLKEMIIKREIKERLAFISAKHGGRDPDIALRLRLSPVPEGNLFTRPGIERRAAVECEEEEQQRTQVEYFMSNMHRSTHLFIIQARGIIAK